MLLQYLLEPSSFLDIQHNLDVCTIQMQEYLDLTTNKQYQTLPLQPHSHTLLKANHHILDVYAYNKLKYQKLQPV